jgi:hypothetical protein
MLAQRLAARSVQRLAAHRAPVRAINRRYATSTEESGVKLPDNAFNREREAVRAHAGQSAGSYFVN